jgi:hypothetical protein
VGALQHGIEIVPERFVSEVGADIEQLHDLARHQKATIVTEVCEQSGDWLYGR